MKRSRVRENPELRRSKIVDEAIRVIGDHGFYGLTVQALAKKCGISNAGLLYYFGSKDAILLAVLAELERQEADILIPLIEAARGKNSPASSRPALLVLFRTIMARFAERPELGRFVVVLQSESLDRSHPAHNWFVQRERLTLELFASLCSNLVPNPLSTARLVIAAMNGLGQQWLRTSEDFDLPHEWDKAIAVIVP